MRKTGSKRKGDGKDGKSKNWRLEIRDWKRRSLEFLKEKREGGLGEE